MKLDSHLTQLFINNQARIFPDVEKSTHMITKLI